jgi:isopropylmalate/homocitrate/citramalate synthase
MLSDEQIQKFQTIHKEKLGIELTREEAYESFAKLIRLLELVYKPMTKAEFLEIYEEFTGKKPS